MSTTSRIAPTRTAACPKCGAEVHLVGRLMIGEVVDCDGCLAPVEVANLEPLRLEPFAKIEEDAEDFLEFRAL